MSTFSDMKDIKCSTSFQTRCSMSLVMTATIRWHKTFMFGNLGKLCPWYTSKRRNRHVVKSVQVGVWWHVEFFV